MFIKATKTVKKIRREDVRKAEKRKERNKKRRNNIKF